MVFRWYYHWCKQHGAPGGQSGCLWGGTTGWAWVSTVFPLLSLCCCSNVCV